VGFATTTNDKQEEIAMKIKFIGVGAAFTTPDYYQSNMLITARSGKNLLLDCGSDARFAFAECNISGYHACEALDAVYISHLHADHIGGMEWLAFSTYFNPLHLKPTLFMEEKQMQTMWEHSLKGGLECVENKIMHLSDFFDCHPLAEDATFNWEGLQATLVKMPHVMTGCGGHYSYGLLLREAAGPTVFISTDTQFQPDLITDIAQQAEVIFHDCETGAFNTPVHAHYNELRTLPTAIKQKMWLYHYQPEPDYNPEADGFKGFVVKGQEFEFSA
jgi:ribonuclease BN (tRNA processing enzyme)